MTERNESLEPAAPEAPVTPTLPLVAYEVCEAVSADADPATFRRVATCRTAASADYLVRVLEQLRASGALFGPDHAGLATFARVTEREDVVAESVDAAIRAGYTVRAVVPGVGEGADTAISVPAVTPVLPQTARSGASAGTRTPTSTRTPAARGIL